MVPKVIENILNVTEAFAPKKFRKIRCICCGCISGKGTVIALKIRPHSLYILRVASRFRINKVLTMIDSEVRITLGKIGNVVIGFPHVRIYDRPRKNVLLD
jgi:hypothetical protein